MNLGALRSKLDAAAVIDDPQRRLVALHDLLQVVMGTRREALAVRRHAARRLRDEQVMEFPEIGELVGLCQQRVYQIVQEAREGGGTASMRGVPNDPKAALLYVHHELIPDLELLHRDVAWARAQAAAACADQGMSQPAIAALIGTSRSSAQQLVRHGRTGRRMVRT